MKISFFVALFVSAGNLYSQTADTSAHAATKESSTTITARFSANKMTVCAGESIQFTDNSTGNPTAWAWQFAGGSIATSSVQNPVIQYNIPGNYNVILTASNANDQNTVGKLALIRVEACTGLNMKPSENGLQIFPVPATSLVYLQSHNNGAFALLNASGQVVQSGNFAANRTTEINIKQLAAGIYFLKSEISGESTFKKLIVQ